MTPEPGFEHAIIGGGVSGSSLAIRLVRRGLGSVVLVDSAPERPRTLCFWKGDALPFEALISHRWSSLRIRGSGREHTLPLRHRRYCLLDAASLRRLAAEEVEAAGGRVLRATATSVRESADEVLVETDDPSMPLVRARWAYDSRPPEASCPEMQQSFVGWWITTPSPVFDEQVATLMDFPSDREACGDGVRFFHVLPVSAHRAFVTAVAVAPDRQTVQLERYLRDGLGLQEWSVDSEESGHTDLVTVAASRRVGQRRLRIGNAGGLLKASTGYAFMSIQRDSDAIVASLQRTRHPFELPRRRWGARFLDRVLLRVIAVRGQRTERVFVGLFEAGRVGRILDFLDERTSVLAALPLFLRLPRWDWFALAAAGALLRPPIRDAPAIDAASSAAVDGPFRHQASGVAFGLSFLLLAYLLAPFLVVLLTATVLVMVSWPSHAALSQRVGHRASATVLTSAVVVLVATPLAIAGWLATQEVVQTLQTWTHFASQGELRSWVDSQLGRLPEALAAWVVAPETVEALDRALGDALSSLANRVGPLLSGLVAVVAEGSMQAAIFVVALWSLYAEGPSLAATARRALPLPDRQLVRLFEVYRQFSWNLLVGMVATSLGQGAVAALGFWLAGAERIALLGAATVVACQVPVVGSAVVWVPVSVALAGQGRWQAALFVAVWSMVLTASVDNVVKPFIYRRGLRVHPALVLLTVLGGLLTWGPAGAVLGPCVLVLFLGLLAFHDPRGGEIDSSAGM
ncbi:MAG: AI-2E family transporter [Myxococcales bacterium]|nr:AI-2E family transporter [Myxococcales bacterium]